MDDQHLTSSPRTVVCVAGMHRSGTSMVARCLSELGFALGDDAELLPASSSNQAGHWEHEGFVEINDELLATQRATWERVPAAGSVDWIATASDALRERARQLVSGFTTLGRWTWKDPRTSVTLPFWVDALAAKPAIVVCVRHPAQVARSLAARGDMDVAAGVALWRTYGEWLLANVASFDDADVWYVDADAVTSDPVRQLRALNGWLGASAEPADVARAVTTVRSELRHHEPDDSLLSDADQAVWELLQQRVATTSGAALSALGDDRAIDAALNDAWRDAAHARGRQLTRVQRERDDALAELETVRAERDRLTRELAASEQRVHTAIEDGRTQVVAAQSAIDEAKRNAAIAQDSIARANQLQDELDDARRELAAIHASRAWQAVDRVRRLRGH